MTRPGTTAGIMCLAAAGLALTACGRVTVDHQQVERQLVGLLAQQEPGVSASASCPTGVVARPGVAFACAVVLDGDRVSYTVTVTGVAGTHYSTAATPTVPVVDTTQLGSAVRQQAGAGATLACGGGRFLQVPRGGSLSCTVSVGAQKEALVIDDQGRFSIGGGAPVTTAPPSSSPATLPGD